MYTYKRYQYPHFLYTAVLLYPLLFKLQVKNLLSTAVNRGNLWRLNYNKTDFARASPGPRNGAHVVPMPSSCMKGDTPFPGSPPELTVIPSF